jgi:hypothetical protein
VEDEEKLCGCVVTRALSIARLALRSARDRMVSRLDSSKGTLA